MPSRTFAIGDIHGCLAALETLLAAIAPTAEDTIVVLGDNVDRGPDSRGVLERLIALASQTRFVPLLGNHDEMMLSVCEGREDVLIDWLLFGGDATLASYEAASPSEIARDYPKHLDFIRNSLLFFESPPYFFVHSNYRADLPLSEQSREDLLWSSLKKSLPGPHVSGQKAVVGHTAQKDGEVLDLGHLVCIDTYCYGDGWLTALEVQTGRLWQADKAGRLRLDARGV